MYFTFGAVSEVNKCETECTVHNSSRLVGPTRPWHKYDKLGNALSLTRPYPYSIAAIDITALKFNLILTVESDNFSHTEYSLQQLTYLEDDFVLKGLTDFYSVKYKSCEAKILKDDLFNSSFTSNNDGSTNPELISFYIIIELKVIVERDTYNLSTTDNFFNDVFKPALLENIERGELNRMTAEYSSKIPQYPIVNRTFSLMQETKSYTVHEEVKVLDTLVPNTYTPFCQFGCSIFYSLLSEIVELSECTHQCDDMYSYNISVGYNDLAEIARLECRDGCQMALIRCQPGYYCSQVRLQEYAMNQPGDGGVYRGGFMTHCPSGTYRDTSYESVEECTPYPPGRFREDIKGRSLESCSKCPIGTYSDSYGSSSITDCLRCPAGTFTNEPGSEFCICITEASCAKNQLPSPADAEKRDTVPYIGRW